MLTYAERMIYEKMELGHCGTNENCYEMFPNSSHNGICSQSDYNEEEKTFYVIKHSILLCNLLLMSPLKNYDIKDCNYKLTYILKYLCRSVLPSYI
jgi:hypothetical protein